MIILPSHFEAYQEHQAPQKPVSGQLAHMYVCIAGIRTWAPVYLRDMVGIDGILAVVVFFVE